MSIRNSLLLLVSFSPLLSKAQNLVVTSSKMNILYIGIENEIEFASKTVPAKEIQLVPERGEIHEFYGRWFYLNCKNEAGELKIYARNKKTNKILDSVLFRLKYLDEPSIRIRAENMTEGVYMGNDILKDIVGISCYATGDFEMPITIISFKLKVWFSDGREKDFVNEGNRFSSSLREELAAMTEVVKAEIYELRVIMGCVKTPRLLRETLRLKDVKK
jgi:GldM C-terminal domain